RIGPPAWASSAARMVAVSVVCRPSTSISLTTRPSAAVVDSTAVGRSCTGICPLITAPAPSPAINAAGAPHSAALRRLRGNRRRSRAPLARVALGIGALLGMQPGERAADAADFPFEHDAELGMH